MLRSYEITFTGHVESQNNRQTVWLKTKFSLTKLYKYMVICMRNLAADQIYNVYMSETWKSWVQKFDGAKNTVQSFLFFVVLHNKLYIHRGMFINRFNLWQWSLCVLQILNLASFHSPIYAITDSFFFISAVFPDWT